MDTVLGFDQRVSNFEGGNTDKDGRLGSGGSCFKRFTPGGQVGTLWLIVI